MSSNQPFMRDYKNPAPAGKPKPAKPLANGPLSTGKFRWLIAGTAIPLIALILALPDSPDATETSGQTDTSALEMSANAETATHEVTLPETSTPVDTTPEPEINAGERLTLTVKSGDSLDRLFRRNNLSINELHKIMQLPLAKEHLRVVRPGDEIEVWRDSENIMALHREIDLFKGLAITRIDDDFVAETYQHDVEYRQVEVAGFITDSLFLSGTNAGLSNRMTMNLTGIFAWDIDFLLDIRNGDEFVVIYEEIWRDGKHVSDGDILAAEFVNQGNSYKALRYKDPNGHSDYYTPDGHSVRKAFLRAPLQFSRISSNFNPNRRHPVLNTIRAHKGVDYAAGRGTPIKAAGDGKITHRGVKGGYGNVIIISHGGNISTLYAHMDSFNRKTRLNGRVAQGQVIGYVGSSGLATGPHLHYEYRVNGVHKNPRTVSLPEAKPIDPAFTADFKQATYALSARLDSQRQRLAANNSSTESRQ